MDITIFKDKNEFKQFEESIKLKGKLLGFGSEGVCYNLDDEAYKIIINSTRNKVYQPNYENVITTSLIDVPSFAFPTHLYVLEGVLRCYKAKVVKNNLFVDWTNISARIKTLHKLDMEKLNRAYRKMEEDIHAISDIGIKTNDLEYNLLFGNEGLVAIDTICYKKDKDCLEYNLRSFRYAIEYKFNSLMPMVLVKETPYIEKMGIDAYLETVEKIIKRKFWL